MSSLDYLSLLARWVPAARRFLQPVEAGSTLLTYGIGNHGHWAMQAHNTAFTAFAELAVNQDTDCQRAGMQRGELQQTALAMLRFTLQSHLAGGGACTDGLCWGHSWISVLGLERMMPGIEALQEYLDENDRGLLRRVLLSEGDWLLDSYIVKAGLTSHSGRNKPESNMWNGAFLWRLSFLYPDAPRVAEYREKGTALLLNAISYPEDSNSCELFAGRELKDWHQGANFFASGACNHHGYLNVGYINVTLSNLALLHFSARRRSWPLPPELYHNLERIMPLCRTMLFPDGRLLRIGGDNRVRYCYCQDYALLVWMLMQDVTGDNSMQEYISGWLAQVQREQEANPDGSFLGNRLRHLEAISPLYYTRLEGDRAGTLAVASNWQRMLDESPPPSEPKYKYSPAQNLSSWKDDYHGALFCRGQRRVASWVWRSAERPTGLCLPVAGSDWAEWRWNLAGRIVGQGVQAVNTPEITDCREFPGGFLTSGLYRVDSCGQYAEGESDECIAEVRLAFAALPDDATVLGLQTARTVNRVFLREIKGLNLNIPNDIWNGGRRTLHSDRDGRRTLGSRQGGEKIFNCGAWLNLDDQMGVLSLSGAELFLHHPAAAQVVIGKPAAVAAGGLLYAEEVCCGACQVGALRLYERAQMLFDIAYAVRVGCSAEETCTWQKDSAVLPPLPAGTGVRQARCTGADGKNYTLCFNIGSGLDWVRTAAGVQSIPPLQAILLAE